MTILLGFAQCADRTNDVIPNGVRDLSLDDLLRAPVETTEEAPGQVPSVLVTDDEAGLLDFLGRPAVGLHPGAGAVDVVVVEDRGVHEAQRDRIGAEILVAQEDVDDPGRHDGTNGSPS